MRYSSSLSVLLLLPGGALTADCALAQAVQDSTYRYLYDANGNLTQVTDPLNRVTRSSFDALNRRSNVTDPALGVVRYNLNALDQLTLVSDQRSNATSYTYDGLDNLLRTSSPDSGLASASYDEAGNLLTRTDANGQRTAYAYDVLDRLVRITHADGSVTAYSYDQGANGTGRLTGMDDSSGSTRFSYDLNGRLTTDIRIIAGQTSATAYRYDAAGRLSGMTYPSGRSIDYTRDGAGRISRIMTTRDGATRTLVSEVRHQPFGPVQSFTFGNGQAYHRSHDLDGRISAYTLGTEAQLITYDPASRITASAGTVNPAAATNFGYDVLDRLTDFLQGGSGTSFSYDAVGNRTSQVIGNATTTYQYPAASNRLAKVTDAQVRDLVSDANGSTLNDGVNQFDYDARGRMRSATSAAGTVQYQVNALGQRVQKLGADRSTLFQYDQAGKLIGETSGQSLIEYVYLDDLPVAMLR